MASRAQDQSDDPIRYRAASELPEVPTAIEVAEDGEVKDMLRVFAVKFKATYPFVLPPEVPADHVEAIRTAFDASMKDLAFLDSAKKLVCQLVLCAAWIYSAC